MSWQNSIVKPLLRYRRWRTRNFDMQQHRVDMEKELSGKPLPDGMLLEKFNIQRIPAAWVKQENANTKRILLWAHGGAFCLGSIETHKASVGNIAQKANSNLLLFDYRLAPEHQFPAAMEDCVEVYRWLLREEYLPENIIIGGDSAGANLVLSAMLKLRKEGERMPKAAVLLSPAIDATYMGESHRTKSKNDPIINNGVIAFAEHYIMNNDRRDPLLSPVYADFTGLPSMYINVGSDEILFSDSLDLARKAREVGVNVTLEVGDDMVHVFPMLSDYLPEAKEAVENIAAYIQHQIPEVDSFLP